MYRKLSIPTVAALGMTTTACSSVDPALGDWVGVQVTSAGNIYDLPYQYTDEFGTYSSNIYLTLREPDRAEFRQIYTYPNGNQDVYGYAGTATRQSKGMWAVLVPDVSMDVTCTAVDDFMSCEGTWYNDAAVFEWERALEQ